MSTPLLPEVVSEIDANPVIFLDERGPSGWGGGVGHVLSMTRQSEKYGEFGAFAASVAHPKSEK